MYREKPFTHYLQEMRVRVLRITIAVGIVTALSMTLSIKTFEINSYKVPLPYPDPLNNIAIQVMFNMRENLLPKNVTLIQVAPGQASLLRSMLRAILGIILTMPVIVRELAGFVGPGLYQQEKTIIRKTTSISIGLFAIGCLFSYFLVIPYVLDFLYRYGETIGISTFFDISEFVPFIMQFMIAFGLSYQLPIIMWAATVSGIVESSFWRNNIRYVIIILVIFGAIITPDGSGVSMWFVTGPMLLLYILGILFIERKFQSVSKKLT